MTSPLEIADDKLRAAHAALAERTRTLAIHAALTPDFEAAEREVVERTAVAAKEAQDVRRYEAGLWAFLYDVFADREGRLDKEQKEAAAAELRLTEATALRDRLRDELVSLAQRAEALANAETEVEVARAGKQAVVVATGGASAAALTAVSDELTKVQSIGRELEEALAAGQRVQATITHLAEVLASARNWGAWDLMSNNSLFASWAKRNQLDKARATAGTAQAELTLFSRELGDLGLSLTAELGELANNHRFLDTWLDNFFTDWTVQTGIVRAQESTTAALATVGKLLDELRRTLAGVLDSSRELSRRRLALLEP